MLRRRLIGFTGLLLFTANITYSQDFERTLRWMHNTAAEGDGHPAGDETMMYVTEIPLTNTCQNFTIIRKTHYYTNPPKPDHVWKVSMNLAAIDPTKVSFTPVKDKPWAYVEIGATDDEDAFQTGPPPNRTSGVGLYFNDPDFAQRLARAFRHAVELCGGSRRRFNLHPTCRKRRSGSRSATGSILSGQAGRSSSSVSERSILI